MMKSRNFEIKSLMSLTTDGAPAMLARGKGLVGRLVKDNPDLITCRCIIDQPVLCASLGDEYRDVLETIMKLVNFLQTTSALQHRLLLNSLSESDASYTKLLVPNNVRWLSRGRVLKKFWSISTELMTFLENQNNAKAKVYLAFVRDGKKMEIFAFLSDMMSHLNDLNVKSQGEKSTVFDSITAIRAFQEKN